MIAPRPLLTGLAGKTGAGKNHVAAPRPLLIGLAGKTGAGKNHVAALLEERGWRTLDLDPVGHRALEALSGRVEEALGPGLLAEDGSVNRRVLGQKVFGDARALETLESIVYPWIERETRRWLEEEPDTPGAVHGVNLHKTRIPEECRLILWVHAPFFVRWKRVMGRDGLPWRDILGRFRSQRALGPKLFSRDAEIYTVRNSGNARRLHRRLDRILRRLGG